MSIWRGGGGGTNFLLNAEGQAQVGCPLCWESSEHLAGGSGGGVTVPGYMRSVYHSGYEQAL